MIVVMLVLASLVCSLMGVAAAALVLLRQGRRGRAIAVAGLLGALVVIGAPILVIGLFEGQWNSPTVPIILALGSVLGPALIISVIVAALKAPTPPGRCASCGYDISATPHAAPCPECGSAQSSPDATRPGGSPR